VSQKDRLENEIKYFQSPLSLKNQTEN